VERHSGRLTSNEEKNEDLGK